jgi:hypothetical protein
MLQVLWERGWINANKLSEYKLILHNDEGFVVKDCSLSILMGSCSDFANEKSQLEYVCQSLGIEALITMKYHTKYAGEGIEYSWGASKLVYHKYPFACKKGKANFDSLVAKCISRDLLTTERICKFSRRARSYMLTSSSLQFIHKGKGQHQVMTNNTFTHTKIENMKKILKSHRAALDFDRGFIITSVLTSEDFNWKEKLESGETKNSKRKHK